MGCENVKKGLAPESKPVHLTQKPQPYAALSPSKLERQLGPTCYTPLRAEEVQILRAPILLGLANIKKKG